MTAALSVYKERRAGCRSPARLWALVARGKGCWVWAGALASNGYARITINGHRDYAHRQAWRLARGSIPRGRFVLHRCDNRACVRPSHLFLGTQAENLADMAAKGRSARGAKNGHAKLTAANVRAIRATYAGHDLSQRLIAERYGVNQSTISFALAGRRTWRHL